VKAVIQKSEPVVYVFLSLKGNRFSRTLNYYHGTLKKGLNSYWIEIDPQNKAREIHGVINRFKPLKVIYVVASPSHVLVPFIKIRTRSRVFLDAGWPLYDGVIQSRRIFGFFGWRFVFTLLLDLVAFHLSSKIFLESPSQVTVCKRRYLLPRNKLVYLATGFDESRVEDRKNQNSVKVREGSVLFRGGPQEEAGLPILFDAIEILSTHKSITFVVVSKLPEGRGFNNSKVEILNNFQEEHVLWRLYESADIVLGQLSNHPRLDKTLPHKFFEAGFFGKTYLTSTRGEIGKYVSSLHVAGFDAGNAEDLAIKIKELLDSLNRRRLYGQLISDVYRKEFAQEVLTEKFMKVIN
jgi:glycosyltransferase involved in cell wall biosynthesis